MREFVSDKIKALKPSGIRKFFDIASQIKDCISLGVGEPDFDTPWAIVEEGVSALEQGKTFYSSNQGLSDLREEICKWNKRKYDLEYSKDEVIVTVGGSEAIDLALRACVEPNDEVIILEPCYVCYEPDVLLSGGTVKRIVLKNENDFKLMPNELEQAISPSTKILILNFPNNPTGSIMDKNDLEKILKIIIKYDLLVISDEIYSELTYQGKHYSIARLEGMKERTLIINGFSKSFSMTGWRLGYLMGPKNIIDQVKKIHQFTIMSAPTPSQYAGIVALKNCDADIAFMRAEYDKRRKFLIHELKKNNIPCFEPKGAFYVFPFVGGSSEDFATKLLQEEKVVVVPGTAFGKSGEGYVRISYAHSFDNIKEAMNRFVRFIKKRNNVDIVNKD